jgi:nucleotide-binding universal stress UspA family protein
MEEGGSMETAVLAVNPTLPDEPVRLIQLQQQVKELQERGLFGWLGIAAVVNPELYPYPLSFYQTVKAGLKHQARSALTASLEKEISFHRLRVLETPTSGQAGVAKHLSRQASKWKVSVLVVSHEERRSLFSRLVKSVSEAAAFTSKVPLLVLKPEHALELRRFGSGILLALDPFHPPSPRALAHVVGSAKPMGSLVRVVTVRVRRRGLGRALRETAPMDLTLREMARAERLLHCAGLSTQSEVIEQEGSVAETLEAYAERHRACMIAVTSPRRGFFRRNLVGSTVRGLIRGSKRPTFVLRTA